MVLKGRPASDLSLPADSSMPVTLVQSRSRSTRGRVLRWTCNGPRTAMTPA